MLKNFLIAFMIICGILPSAIAAGIGSSAPTFSLLWGIPFVLVLGSLALLPMIMPRIWHAHFVKIIAIYTLGFLIPLWHFYGGLPLLTILIEILIHHYLPFLLLISALYITAGGIQLKIKARASAVTNTLILSFATFVAGWIGTTGAAMLFIRPFLNLNRLRRHRQHLILFFILLVCNIGGGLTPLGDPPLFLGYLEGISFWWPLCNLTLPLLTLAVPLLIIFYIWDRWRQEDPKEAPDAHAKIKFEISGFQNFFYLISVIGLVLLSSLWKSNIGLNLCGHVWHLESMMRDLGLIVISALSYFKTDSAARHANHFQWAPLKEVAVLFAAIFITAYPVLEMLKFPQPEIARWLAGLNHSDGTPAPLLYFWASGTLSSFLDNAPTYLVFFNMAGGNPQEMMGHLQSILLAISTGSVFMGALTYIGNAPNFMVKAIAEDDGITMPHFFGYTLRAALLLLPILWVMTWLFF